MGKGTGTLSTQNLESPEKSNYNSPVSRKGIVIETKRRECFRAEMGLPDSTVVETSPSNAEGAEFDPWLDS